jgi:SPP1 family predicted phage head-tail adaptor
MSQAAGKLRHRIRLESLQTEQDSNGDTVEEWTSQGDVWAEVVPSSAREFVASDAMQSRVVARITVRRRDDIQPNWRILWRGQYYNIEGVLPDPVSGREYFTLPVSYHIIAP